MWEIRGAGDVAQSEAMVEQLAQFLFGAIVIGAATLAQYALVMFFLGY